MAVPTHLKIVFRGIFENTEEEWSFSTKWSRQVSGGGDAGTSDINQDGVSNAISALINTQGAARFGSSTLVTEWRAYQMGTNNRMEGNPLQVTLATPARGAAANIYGSSTSLCVTLVGADRGPGRFGRFFLPSPAEPVVDFRLTLAKVTAYETAITAFLKSVSDAIDLPNTVNSSEMLNVSLLPAPGGSSQVVDHVEVGRVLDNLSTRRRQLDEERYVGGHIDW